MPAGDTTEAVLRSHLQEYARSRKAPVESQDCFSYALADLNGDGKREAIVRLIGPFWCGTGGCQTLILKPVGRGYQTVCVILGTRPPIKVLAARTKGWQSISVLVAGGGIYEPYEAELPFDGTRYPVGPSMPPASHLSPSAAGEVVISSTAAEIPLYP